MTSQYPRWPSSNEAKQVQAALEGKEVAGLQLTVENGSPWLQIDARVYLEGIIKLALWRATGAVYRVGEDGAVEDDPFISGYK